MDEGWKQSVEGLDACVAISTEETAHREIVAMRVFDAPRELVFTMWTDPKHVVSQLAESTDCRYR